MLDKMPQYSKTLEVQFEKIFEILPDGLQDLCTAYEELLSANMVQLFNPAFSGGVVSCLKKENTFTSDHLVVHAEGQQLQRLKIQRVEDSGRLLQAKVVMQMVTDPIFQVCTSFYGDTMFVATRHKHRVSVFSAQLDSLLAGSEELINLETKEFDENEAPTFVSLSPYTAAEGLYVTNNGTVCIWRPGSFEKVLTWKKHRFACHDPWRQVHYGSHPRHLIVTDRTAVEIFDHRKGYSNGVDLFSLPSKLLDHSERIMAAHPHGFASPYHLLATENNFFLLDQRFPGTPVMHWHPDLLKPPQYITSTNITMSTSEISSIALVASQQPAETMCYPFDYTSQSYVTAPFLPWRLSCMSDITYFKAINGIQDSKVARQRLGTSLAGVAVLEGQMPESIITYQVDSFGEIFYQCYGRADVNSSDKTCSRLFGAESDFLEPVVHHHVTSWFSKFHKDIAMHSSRFKREGQTFVSMKDDLISSDARECWRCSESISIDTDDDRNDDDQAWRGTCGSCKQYLHQASGDTISKEELEARLLKKPRGDLSALDFIAPPLTTYAADNAHTKIHHVIAYPQENEKTNMEELLQKRDEERKSKLLEHKQQKSHALKKIKHKIAYRKREKQQSQSALMLPLDDEHRRENVIIEQILSGNS
ncbi:TATA box-binding protein-associated factor RNA polymerase I subunit C-like isoform X2 [Pomacea canaliculata]|nr:TATA box-binding protein-associated factor RNA polymerase I subunit C-like isoform X2 [Pomacea canaliculata]